jgi:DNA-binding protein YbaB
LNNSVRGDEERAIIDVEVNPWLLTFDNDVEFLKILVFLEVREAWRAIPHLQT